MLVEKEDLLCTFDLTSYQVITMLTFIPILSPSLVSNGKRDIMYLQYCPLDRPQHAMYLQSY